MGEAKRRRMLGVPSPVRSPDNDRRRERAELRSTWAIYHPLTPGVPLKKEQLEKLEDAPVGSRLDEHGILQSQAAPGHQLVSLESRTGDDAADALLANLLAKPR